MATTNLYTLYELQDEWSTCEPTEHFAATSLKAAKCRATREKVFQGTVLKLFVNGYCASIKKNGVWKDCE